MNQINFLPPSFFRQRFRRRRIAIEVLLVAAVAVALGAWFVIGDRSLHQLRSEAEHIQAERAQVENQIKEMTQLQAEFRELSGQMRIHREVTLPVGFTQVLAAIAQVTPESIGYTDLRLETNRPVPAPKPLPADDKAKKTGRARPAPAKPAESIKIELIGLSPDDRRIADLLGKLADHPLFTQVKLDYSKTVEQDEVVARRFRLLLQVPLDREYRATREGVANAD